MATADTTDTINDEQQQQPAKKRHYGFHHAETALEACQRMSTHYQEKFPVIPALKSTEFLAKYNPENVILIDCRTRPERAVSMIQGAIPMEGLNLLETLQTKNDKKKTIITYCSVGYRSGLEAQHIQDTLHGDDVMVMNLDGILAYTHALQQHPSSGPPLIDPSTGQVTKEVHSFSHQWDCAAEDYTSKQFGTMEATMRMGQVASHAAVRKAQHAAHVMTTSTTAMASQE